MKLTLSAKPFAALLKAVLPAVATRPGLPILSGVRLEASEGGLIIEATDLELIAKAVLAMPDSKIELASVPTDGRADLDVRAGTPTVTLQAWATEDWPSVSAAEAIDPIGSIDASAAADAFETVPGWWPRLLRNRATGTS